MKYNILYVDDEQANLDSFKSIFRRKFNILTALSGIEGLKVIESHPISIVISDQRMNEMSGIEFLKIAKEKYPNIKYILLTAFSDNEIIKRAINEIGIYWYLNKPFDHEKLEFILTKAAQLFDSEKENITLNKKFQMILSTAQDAIISMNKEYDIVMANPAALKMFGYQEEGLIGLNLSILLPPNVKNHSQLIKGFGRSVETSKSMKPNKIIFGKCKSGELIPIETNLSKMELNGNLFFNAVIRDVSEKIEAQKIIQESEEKFKGIFNSMIDVFVRRTFEGDILLVSPSVFDITGFTPEEIITRKVPNYFLDKEDPNKIAQKLTKFGGVQSFDSEIIKKDGSVIIISSNARLFYDDGTPIGIESVFRDITEKKRAEIKIADSQKRLKKLAIDLTITEEKMRKRIANDLHDDVGQLLSSSRMQMAAIDFDGDRELIKEKIGRISESLLLAMKATREVIFNLSPPQLNEIGLYAAIHDWMKEEIEKKHSIRTSIIGDNVIYDLDDNARLLLFRSVKELLNNIIKHAQANSIKVILRNNYKSLIIAVKDDGIGFDYGSKKSSLANIGYGLFSIQERISNLGGSMTVVSRLNFGTEIKLNVPRE